MFFIQLTFLLCSFDSHILLQNCFVSFASGCWYVLEHSTPTCWLNFRSLFLECYVLFLLFDAVSASFKSLFFCQSRLIYLFKLCCPTCLLFCFELFIQTYPCVFFFFFYLFIFFACLLFLTIFVCCQNFFTCPSSLIFSFRFCSISFGSRQFYLWLISLLHILDCLI